MSREELTTPNGEPYAYATLERHADGTLTCYVSGALQGVVDARGAQVGLLETRQSRRLSREREAAAFQRAIKAADCCAECTQKIQQHYDSMLDLRAEHDD